jgi:1,4-dihydroxy-2-naphthoyl-CoA hydrolase
VGLDGLLGIRVEQVSGDRVVAVCPVTPDLYQPYGLVHGGVYAVLAETAASYGAASWLKTFAHDQDHGIPEGDQGGRHGHARTSLGDRGGTFGISNHTDFLRPVREGTLRAEATPLARGRTTQLWQVAISDDRERLVAHGRVRLINLAEVPG